MGRPIDDRKKRKALRKLRQAKDLAEQGLGPPLSDWEETFLSELEERIETFGSAFADPTKGDLDEPLSALQTMKLKEIDKKARGKGSGGFKQRKPLRAKTPPKARQVDDDRDPPSPGVLSGPLRIVSDNEAQPTPSRSQTAGRPKLKVVEGGNGGDDA